MNDRITKLLVIIFLAIANAVLCWQLNLANERTRTILKDRQEWVKRANRLGFASSLYGYRACKAGMDFDTFFHQAADIFSGTNCPDIPQPLSITVRKRL